MFWVIRFILFWLVWILLADKKRWKELLPVCFFAALIGSTTDTIMHHYQLWIYETMQTNLLADITDDWSVYIVVTYLFIQWLPKDKGFLNMFLYWVAWTTITITIELIHVYSGHMSYPKQSWWNPWWSYGTDWLLFWVFYKFHQIFNHEKLSL